MLRSFLYVPTLFRIDQRWPRTVDSHSDTLESGLSRLVTLRMLVLVYLRVFFACAGACFSPNEQGEAAAGGHS